MKFQSESKYFDLHVNGYAGIDFNKLDITEKELEFACYKLFQDGVEGILVTLITDDFERMILKVKNLSSLIKSNNTVNSIIKGIHVEGPFLNPADGFRGAHPKEHVLKADLDKVKGILNAGNGLIRLFTLSPEVDSEFKLIRYLIKNNVVVSAGHSDASLDQLQGAIESGLKMFTHLGNGTPNILQRHNNIINRVLSVSDQIYVCFIADGIHIPDFALKNYLRAVDINRCIITTDCMSAASAPPGKYSISHIRVEVGKDKIVRELGKDNLAGSAITMHESEQFLAERLSIEETQIDKMLYQNAKNLLKL